MDPEIVGVLATAGALVAGPVVSWFTARLATRATREAAVTTSEPSHREQDRLNFLAMLNSAKAESDQQIAVLRTDVQDLRTAIAKEQEGRAEDRRLCAEERGQAQRKIDALLRGLWAFAGVLQTLNAPIPEFTERDKRTLEEYDLPGV